MSAIQASMAGSVWKILVSEGGKITSGQDVIILESMKMEIPISSDEEGIVKAIHVQEGDFVNEGDDLIEME